MYTTVFRNNNPEGLTQLLKEIGEYRLFNACKNRQLQKPRLMKNFYLECTTQSTYLIYKYPEAHHKVMQVDGYKNVPVSGWVLVR